MIEPIDVRDLMTDKGVGRYKLRRDQVIGIAGHHSVSGGDFYDGLVQRSDDELHHLLMIDQLHASNGWSGFAYHLAAFASRRLYLCGSLDGARAHVASRNHQLIGIVLIGNFSTSSPLPVHLETAAAGVAYIRRMYPGIELSPHRLWALPEYPTSCPGDTWTAWLPALDSPPQEEDDMRLIRAANSGAIYVVGESGKRWIDDAAEVEAYKAAGYGVAEVSDAQAGAIPDVPKPLRLVRGNPSGAFYVIGVAGKRYIDDLVEVSIYKEAGWGELNVTDNALAAIPTVGS